MTATQGSVDTSLSGETAQLYAPTPWEPDISLNTYTASSHNVKLCHLLTNQFGKGSVIRDVSGENYRFLYNNDLYWNYIFTTGYGSTTIVAEGSPEINIPYRGGVVVGIGGSSNNSYAGRYVDSDSLSNIISHNKSANADIGSGIDPVTYIKKFSIAYDQSEDREIYDGWIVSLLKKDGTWDCVMTGPVAYSQLNVNVDDFELHYPKADYARTCDGKLRCRIAKIERRNGEKKISVDYYVIEELPQMVDLSFSRLTSNPVVTEYLRDVEIGMKNLEGVDRIIAEVWVEGERNPQIHKIEDFKKGYFTVTVDKEFYTDIKVTAYNKNGSTESETYRLEPLEPADYEVEAALTGDIIEFRQPGRRRAAVGSIITYEIAPIDCFGATAVMSGEVTINDAASTAVDVSGLNRGLYALRYTAPNGREGSMKFMKR